MSRSDVRDEYNVLTSGNDQPSEMSSVGEYYKVNESLKIKGYNEAEEFGDTGEKTSGENSNGGTAQEDDEQTRNYLRNQAMMSGNVVGMVTSSVATFALVVIVGTSLISNMKQIDAKLDIDVTATTLSYYLSINQDPEKVFVQVRSNKDTVKQDLGEDYVLEFNEEEGIYYIGGKFTDLEMDTDYEVGVYAKEQLNNKLVTSLFFKTLEEPVVSELSEFYVTYECLCGADGFFHFKIDFEDDLGRYKDFKASLVDEYGNVESIDIANPHEEQKIAIVGSKLSGENAVFRIWCYIDIKDEYSMEEHSIEEIIFEEEVEI